MRKPRPVSYLTPPQAEAVIAAAGKVGRHRTRDKALILLLYRHGLRISEALAIKWAHVDLAAGTIHLTRLKRTDTERHARHPLSGVEIRLLRRLQREVGTKTPFVLSSERGGPLARNTAYRVVERAGQKAGIDFPVSPHMLRHSCGYKLANDCRDTRLIQEYLGHRSIKSTARYTALAHGRFEGLWAE